MSEAGRTVSTGELDPSDILKINPALLNIGYPKRQGLNLKNIHTGDFAINYDKTEPRTGGNRSKNILVEVELTTKSYAEYLATLQTLAIELRNGLIFDKTIYFTVGKKVPNLMKKIDRNHEIGIFDTGKLIVLPLTDPYGELVKPKRRIQVPPTQER